VYINVATTGANKKQFAANRIDIPYPTGSKVKKRCCTVGSSVGGGVYINVATTGANKKQFAANRIDIPYPTGSKVTER
jgi:hypothetical protein